MDRPFEFCHAMAELCDDITCRMPETFGHVRMDQVFIGYTQARAKNLHGMQARIFGLRFEGGSTTIRKNGRLFICQQMDRNGIPILYILNFFLPRFQNQPFQEKLVTVFHELFHISPEFDGTLRIMEGRCRAHGNSAAEYDRTMGRLVDQYLDRSPPAHITGFLRFNFRGLAKRHGSVVGVRVKLPKVFPVSAAHSG